MCVFPQDIITIKISQDLQLKIPFTKNVLILFFCLMQRMFLKNAIINNFAIKQSHNNFHFSIYITYIVFFYKIVFTPRSLFLEASCTYTEVSDLTLTLLLET